MRLGVLVVCATTLVHAETRPHYSGTLDATLLGMPATFDPVAARAHAELTVVGLVYDTLYKLGPDGDPQPHLAVGAPVLDVKNTTVRITLRRGVRMHDGSELTAQDVAASLLRAQSATRWVLAPVTAIKADGDAIELTLNAPIPELTLLLSLPQTAITKGKPGKLVGSGPFTIAASDRKKLELHAFDGHFAGPPYANDLVLRWYDTPDGEARRFETGNAHLSARGVAAFAGAQPTFESRSADAPASLLLYVGFGKAHAAITGDKRFRRAIDLALARTAFTTIGSGERVIATRVPVPDGAPPPQVADVDAAKAILPVPATKEKLTILVEDTRPDDRDIAARVVFQLARIGVSAVIELQPADKLRERTQKGDYDFVIAQLAAPVSATSLWWAAAFAAGNDDWPVAQLRTGTLDVTAAAKAFDERLPIIPLAFRSTRLWYRTDVHGVTFDLFGRPCFADMFMHGKPTKGRP